MEPTTKKTETAYVFTFDVPDKENPINSLMFRVATQASSEHEALLITRRKFAQVVLEINNRLGEMAKISIYKNK